MVTKEKNRIRVMTGNEACAEGALAAGCRFFAGYPITPSSEIAEILSRELPKVGGKFIQMEDEIAAMGAVIGASLAGSKSLTATSGPGFSLKQENIGYASMAEVPCVIVNVMRGGPSTGLPTLPSQSDVMQARWGTHGDHPIIALAPSSVRESFDWTVRAFNLSETYRVPVVLLLDEIVGHTSEKVVLPDTSEIQIVERQKGDPKNKDYLPYKQTESDIPPMISFGEGIRFHVTGLCHDETGFPTNDSQKIDLLLRRLNRKIERYRDQITDNQRDQLDDADVAVFAYGSTSRSARWAVRRAREEGLRVGLFRPIVLWPFPEDEVFSIAQKVHHIIVPEMNLGQMAHEVEWASRGSTDVIRINRIDGDPVRPQVILEKIKEVA
ncbi:MAG: 2-oxoacid:acceptor oxidoreductase subunit alpha [Gemmatimonadota bacterium]|nr:MAG: 2-oxoacid:acceptor oxidoreductase subunit alpha [Gemmatimonadota bacterium]